MIEIPVISDKKKIIGDLAESWCKSGIDKGDTVLVHSSLSSFLKKYRSKGIDVSPEDILSALMKTAGAEGTLMFPTYNFEFTQGKVFDIRNTRSETGVLTETARLNKNSVRTGHPLFSFAVIGFHKNKFQGLYNFSAFGNDSPFAKLLELDGKIAALDVAGENCMTFYHYIEEMENAPNRYHKIFKGPYIDYDGVQTIREFGLYARDLKAKVETDVKPFEEYLWEKGMYTGDRPGTGSCMHVIKAKDLYNEAAPFIREGKSRGMLYRIEGED